MKTNLLCKPGYWVVVLLLLPICFFTSSKANTWRQRQINRVDASIGWRDDHSIVFRADNAIRPASKLYHLGWIRVNGNVSPVSLRTNRRSLYELG